jgi:hypothetical protein
MRPRARMAHERFEAILFEHTQRFAIRAPHVRRLSDASCIQIRMNRAEYDGKIGNFRGTTTS